MAIAPVGIVDYKASNNVHFGHRSHKNDSVHSQEPKVASKMVTIPLATLMTLMPLANSNNDAVAQTRASEQTELLAQNTKKSKLPFVSAFAHEKNIVHTERFEFAGEMHNLVFCSERYDQNASGPIKNVYVIPDGYNKPYLYQDPPTVLRLIHHNIGENEYCGILVREEVEFKNGPTRRFYTEYKLPDDVANTMVTFLAGKNKKLENQSKVGFEQTTNPRRMTPYVTDMYGNPIE